MQPALFLWPRATPALPHGARRGGVVGSMTGDTPSGGRGGALARGRRGRRVGRRPRRQGGVAAGPRARRLGEQLPGPTRNT